MFEGIVHITGEHDTGKTLFALQAGAAPERICFFDDDVKGRATVKRIQNFGAYHDLVGLGKGKTELAFYTAVRKLIDDIKPDLFDCIIFDTWTNFASKANAFVLANPGNFKTMWSPMGQIKGAQQWQETRRLEAEIINQMAELCKTLILITHLKPTIINGVKVPGKFEPAHSPVLERVANLRIWLRQNPNSAVPVGLVLKRITTEVVTERGIRSVNALPRKLVPSPEDESLWDTIQRYLDNPFGNRAAEAHELPTEFEVSILDSTLTKDQKQTFTELLRAGAALKEEEGEIAASFQDIGARVKEMLAEKKPIPVIAKALHLTIADVNRLSTEIDF